MGDGRPGVYPGETIEILYHFFARVVWVENLKKKKNYALVSITLKLFIQQN